MPTTDSDVERGARGHEVPDHRVLHISGGGGGGGGVNKGGVNNPKRKTFLEAL